MIISISVKIHILKCDGRLLLIIIRIIMNYFMSCSKEQLLIPFLISFSSFIQLILIFTHFMSQNHLICFYLVNLLAYRANAWPVSLYYVGIYISLILSSIEYRIFKRLISTSSLISLSIWVILHLNLYKTSFVRFIIFFSFIICIYV